MTNAVVKEFETQVSLREQTIAAKRKLIEANERMNREALAEIARSEAIIVALKTAIDSQAAEAVRQDDGGR